MLMSGGYEVLISDIYCREKGRGRKRGMEGGEGERERERIGEGGEGGREGERERERELITPTISPVVLYSQYFFR